VKARGFYVLLNNKPDWTRYHPWDLDAKISKKMHSDMFTKVLGKVTIYQL